MKRFLKLHSTYLLINLVVMIDAQIVPLDYATKIDETAAFLVEPLWQGGVSVVLVDIVCDKGFGHELANYDEYSGAPSKKTRICMPGRSGVRWQRSLSSVKVLRTLQTCL